MKVGLVVHAGRDESVAVAQRAAAILAGADVEVVVARPPQPDEQIDELLGVDAEPVLPEVFASGLDVALSFGGDGTFLRAAHLCRDADVPVLGVNLGRLGFLAEVEVEELATALDAVIEGRFSIERRATLDVSVHGASGEPLGEGWALNEVSVEKTARQRLLLMDVYVKDTLFARVPADALVLATPTGSTAYALSAGGPILSPSLEATLVVPVAPHSLFDRTIVAGPEEEVRVELLPGQAPALISCDGRPPIQVDDGGTVRVRGAGHPVLIARTGEPDFYRLVREKFGLR